MERYVAHEEEYKGVTIKIYPDNNAESPREDGNLGMMSCWHRRYNLGDEQPKVDAQTWLCDLARSFTNFNDLDWNSKRYDKLEDMTTDEAMKILEKHIFLLPLYLYDHSGITMKTSPFSCRWDSGQVGWIHMTKEKFKAETSRPGKLKPDGINHELVKRKHLTQKDRAKAYEYLVDEVATYDQYLTGDVYGYEIGDGDESCWGFYGEEECIKEARSIVDWKEAA